MTLPLTEFPSPPSLLPQGDEEQARRHPTAPPPSAFSLSVARMLAYGLGQSGGQIFRDTPAVLLPIFLITVLDVPAWMAGLSILVPKLWVIFCDPLVGMLSDRTSASWGRRRLLVFGAVLSAASFVLLFLPPHFPAPWMAAAYNTVLFTLASTAFSLFSVPYLTIGAEMSDDTHVRTTIMAYRVGFSALGLIVGAGVAQPLVAHFGGGRGGYLSMALIFGAICLLTMLTAFIGTRGLPLGASAGQAGSPFQQFRLASKNRPFVILAATYLIEMVGMASGYSVLGLYFIYIAGNVSLVLPFIMIMAVTAMLIQPFWVWMARRLGKLGSYGLAVVFYTVVTASWFITGDSHDVLIRLPFAGALSTRESLILLRAFLIGIFNSGFLLMGLSMLTDTIEHDRLASGVARDGVYCGIFSAIEKLSFALGPAVTGIVLSVAGFRESSGGGVAQDAGALQGILIAFGGIPAASFVISLFVLRRYRLDTPFITAVTAPPRSA